MKYRQRQSTERGFTLLEMLVSLAIFIVVAVIAVGSLVRITALNRQAQTLQASMNNINFVLESMSREMRFGSSFYCSGALPGGWSNLDPGGCDMASAPSTQPINLLFLSTRTGKKADNTPCRLITGYRFRSDNGKLVMEKGIQRSCGSSISSWAPILDDVDVTLTGYQLGVYPMSGANEKNYAWAFVRLKGYAGTREREINNFDVQTAVSERIHD